MILSTFSGFSKLYNSEETWLPLIAPLVVWTGCFVYCSLPASKDSPAPPSFHRWESLHNVYNYVAILIALTSLYYNDDSVLSERVGILYTISYFVVDLVDCAIRFDVAYTLHAVLCIVAAAMNHSVPPLRELRMNSRANLCEVSSPVFFVAKKTRKPAHFLLFAATFTLCRVVWIPLMIRRLLQHRSRWTDLPVIWIMMFYCLNLFWYSKIVRILVKVARGEDVDDKPEETQTEGNKKEL